MAETTDDVRRDIELTRERMSSTFAELEQKLNAMGAGVLLSGSGSDVKAAAATVAATKGASNKLSEALDDVVSQLMTGVHSAVDSRVDGWVGELKTMIGAAAASAGGQRSTALTTADQQAPLEATRAD